MALDLLQTAPQPVDGLYVYMPNTPQPHNCIVSSTETNILQAGDIVTLDTTSTNTNCPVIKLASPTDPVFGIIPFDAIKNNYKSLDKCMVVIEGSYIWKKAAAPIALGAKLYFDTNMAVTSTVTAGNSIVGFANTVAPAKDDFVQVKLKFETTAAATGA